MSFPKILALTALLLFGAIGTIALFKGSKKTTPNTKAPLSAPLEIELDNEIQIITPNLVKKNQPPLENEKLSPPTPETLNASQKSDDHTLPNANRIEEFFNKGEPKLPIVETITYKSRVSWQKGRPAWLSDYANHYQTSRHFIARSLNGKPDYFKQDLAEGDRFNVLRKDKNIRFYLLIDLSRSKMWFYYDDLDTNDRILLKTYQVGLGRIDSSKPSGMLTPVGKYTLGDRIAIYKPKMMGNHQGKKTEMIRVFGTRWIPFSKEISGCSAPAKGFGIHGLPWNDSGEDRSSLGKYESDGCIRLASEDMEELFAIVITKPTIIELAKDFYDVEPTNKVVSSN